MAKLLLDEKNVIKSWQTIGNGWSNTEYITVEVEEIPEYIKETFEKYCYVNGEYIENPDYVPPDNISDTDVLNVLLGVNE